MHLDLSTTLLATFAASLLALLPLSTVTQQDPAKASLPSSVVPTPRNEEWGIGREKECIRRAREAEPARVVFVGDSITQGWEGEGSEFWRAHFDTLGALNLGNSGDRTEHVLHRLAAAPITRLSPDHVVLMIGTNNLGHGKSNADDTLAGVKAIVETLVAQTDHATIHVLEIFPRGERMNAMRGDIAQVNQALRAHVRTENAKQKQGPGRLRIHAIGDLFVDARGEISPSLMPDALHLSKDGYSIWGEALLPLVAK
jgi:lysophospholipase L1-like esterase